MPATIVIPEREIPGASARICAAPIVTARPVGWTARRASDSGPVTRSSTYSAFTSGSRRRGVARREQNGGPLTTRKHAVGTGRDSVVRNLDGAQATGPDDDPDPSRRVARRILQRLDGMGKWGGYHTEFAHLARGFAGNDRALAERGRRGAARRRPARREAERRPAPRLPQPAAARRTSARSSTRRRARRADASVTMVAPVTST